MARASDSGGSREDRFEAILEERFSPEARRRFARTVDAHDRERGGAPEDLAATGALEPRLRFHGEVPQRVQGVLRNWLPALMAHAHEAGLRLPHVDLHVAVYTPDAFAAEQQPLPEGLHLPASSYAHDPQNRRYTVRVVLPHRLETLEGLLTVVRALLARILGEVFLREEVWPLEPYREASERGDAALSVGLDEQLVLLAELPHTPPELEQALQAHARQTGLSWPRRAEQVRKDFFRAARADLAAQRLDYERRAAAEAAFAAYVAELRSDPHAGAAAMVEALEQANGQLNFLPPHELPDYLRLRERNPAHYLRAAALRLGQALEVLNAVVEDFDALEEGAAGAEALITERVTGHREQLQREGLARPYLVPGVRLSEELEQQRRGFPLEVHALVQRMPAGLEPNRTYHWLYRKLENSLWQRLLHALVLLRHWLQARERGGGGDFAGGEHHSTLKGLVANLRFRQPLLHALAVRTSVVLEVLEHAGTGEAGGNERHFPVQAFQRAWGPFAAHAVTAGYLARAGQVRGFDPARYWRGVEERLAAQPAGAPGEPRLVLLLRALQQASTPEGDAAATDGLARLVGMLRAGGATWQFVVRQAVQLPDAPEPPGDTPRVADWHERIGQWARTALQADEERRRHEITPGTAE